MTEQRSNQTREEYEASRVAQREARSAEIVTRWDRGEDPPTIALGMSVTVSTIQSELSRLRAAGRLTRPMLKRTGPYRCTACGTLGHNARTCARKAEIAAIRTERAQVPAAIMPRVGDALEPGSDAEKNLAAFRAADWKEGV